VILTIRPEPGCTATARAGRAAGLAIEGQPLFEVRPLVWEAPAAEAIDALLIGSANAVRQAGSSLDSFRAKPVYSVGETTAAAAQAAGLTVASIGRADLQSLIETLTAPMRLLRLTGAEHVPLAEPAGIEIETRVVYESAPLPLPDELAAKLRGGALVLLLSAAAARHFASECDRCEVPRSTVAIAALAPRIVDAAGQGWREVRSAAERTEAALLALARDMCH